MTARSRRTLVSRAVVSCALSTVVAGVALVCSGPARATSVPADPAAHGYIGLCGVDGKPMTGGSIYDKPFVWKAISSQPAPAESQGPGKVTELFVYQPRPGTEPYDWNGDSITATSPYSTPSHPTAQATKADYALAFVVKDYPPMVDGLYELRMYFGNRQSPLYPDQYAATFIRVTGDRWNVVKGGIVDCHSGRAVSPEVQALGRSAAGTPTAHAPYGGPSGTGVPTDRRGVPVPGATSANTQSGAGSGSASHSTPGAGLTPGETIQPSQAGSATDPTNSSGVAAAASSTSNDGSSLAVVLIVIIVVVLVAGGGWFAYRRLRR